jgi:hypothetical protein
MIEIVSLGIFRKFQKQADPENRIGFELNALWIVFKTTY